MYKIIIILSLISIYNSYSQCSCLNGASASNFSPVIDQTGKFISNKGDLIISAYYKYGIGNKFFEGNKISESEYLKEFVSHYSGIFAKYNITRKFSSEINIGYYPLKKQTFETYEAESNGFSNIMLILNYNLFGNDLINYSIGAGTLIPLGNDNIEGLPQHLLANGGSYGIIINSDLKYNFEDYKFTVFIINRAIINYADKNDYLYGNTLINSLMISKTFSKFISSLEIRNEIRAKDKYKEIDINDSGSLQFFLSPKIGISLNKFTILAVYDFPIYSYYYGKQMGNNYSLSFNIYYSTNILGYGQ